jgi:hypothetical protein
MRVVMLRARSHEKRTYVGDSRVNSLDAGGVHAGAREVSMRWCEEGATLSLTRSETCLVRVTRLRLDQSEVGLEGEVFALLAIIYPSPFPAPLLLISRRSLPRTDVTGDLGLEGDTVTSRGVAGLGTLPTSAG